MRGIERDGDNEHIYLWLIIFHRPVDKLAVTVKVIGGCSVMDHHTFRTPRAPGSIYQVRRIVRMNLHPGTRGVRRFKKGFDINGLAGEKTGLVGCGDYPFCIGILSDQLYSLHRIFGVARDVGRPGLHHAINGRDQTGIAGKEHHHLVAPVHPFLAQGVGQTVGLLVKFPESQASVACHKGQSRRI